MPPPSAPPDWNDPFALTPPSDGDDTGWLVTFSDLVLQLFAFVLVAAVCGAAARAPKASDATVLSAAEPARTVVEEPHARIETVPPPAVLAPASAWAGEQPHAATATAEGAKPSNEEAIVSPRDVAAPESDPTAPESVPDAATRERMHALGGYLAAYVAAAGLAVDASVDTGDSDVRLALAGNAGFQAASAELRPAGRRLLGEVARLVSAVPELAIEVAGYTDDVPINTRAFPSNLELSLARAARVARELEGDDPTVAVRTVALGFGEHRPSAPNDGAAGRARNRRVELRLSAR